jgi:hypothetical protein
MNFIVISPEGVSAAGRFNSQPHFYVEPQTPKSTSTGEFPHEIHPAPQSTAIAKVIAVWVYELKTKG